MSLSCLGSAAGDEVSVSTSADFNAYHQWLGIPPEEQPANYYRLLGMRAFENDPQVIANSADRHMAHLRTCQKGQHAALAQQLLNEVARARMTLLSADKKAAYDQQLRAALSGAAARPPARAPLPVAKSVAPATAPTPGGAAEEDANPLGFDPLAAGGETRRSKRKSSSLSPLLAAGGFTGLCAIAGVVGWVVLRDGSPAPSVAQSRPAVVSPAAQQVAAADESDRHHATSEAVAEPEPDAAPATEEKPSKDKSAESARPLQKKPLAASSRKSKSAPAATDGDAEGNVAAVSETGDDDEMLAASPSGRRKADAEDEPADAAGSSEAPQKETRLPVPAAADVTAATAEIRSLFKENYTAAKTPSAKAEWAEKLLTLYESSEDPKERYALANEALKVAMAANNPALAMDVITLLATDFEIQRIEMAADTCEQFAKKELTSTLREELLDALTSLVDEAMAAGQFKSVKRLTTMGLALARKANKPDVAKSLNATAKQAAELEELAGAVDAAKKRLADNPDDADANWTLGSYLIISQGDWPEALVHLSKASDPGVQGAAEQDLTEPTDATARVTAADTWFELAEKQSGTLKDAFRGRAGYWYQLSLDDLQGLMRTKVEKQLAAIGATGPGFKPAQSKAIAGKGGKVEYLIDLPATEVRVHDGNTDAILKARPQWGLTVGGQASRADIYMHAVSGSSSHAAWNLTKNKFRYLAGGAGISDKIREQGRAETFNPLTFRIVGDGKELWKSKPLQMAGASQDFRINIGAIKRLELFIDCPGDNSFGQSLWMAPRLTNERGGPTTAPATASGAPAFDAKNGEKGSKDGPLQVLSAKYGANNTWMDVTDRIKSLVRGKSLTFTVEFWYTVGDQSPGTPKSLRLSYRLNGKQIDKEFPHLAVVTLGSGPPLPKDAPRGLVITQALWGVADQWVDVTELVQKHVQDNRLKGVATAAWMGYGGDPLRSVLKTLAIRYYYHGSRKNTRKSAKPIPSRWVPRANERVPSTRWWRGFLNSRDVLLCGKRMSRRFSDRRPESEWMDGRRSARYHCCRSVVGADGYCVCRMSSG